MTNIFERVRKKMDGTSLWVFIVSATLLFIGIGLFVEDTMTSRDGIARLMVMYDLELNILEMTPILLSLAPQAGQVVFFYVWLAEDRKKKWPLLLSFSLFAIDFAFDLSYRTRGIVGFDERTLVAVTTTLAAFTIGSELCITFGYGILLEVADDAMDQVEKSVIPLGQRMIQLLFGGLIGIFKANNGQRQNTRQDHDRPDAHNSSRHHDAQPGLFTERRNGDRVSGRSGR